jgi:hypothetical protein
MIKMANAPASVRLMREGLKMMDGADTEKN